METILVDAFPDATNQRRRAYGWQGEHTDVQQIQIH